MRAIEIEYRLSDKQVLDVQPHRLADAADFQSTFLSTQEMGGKINPEPTISIF